MAQPPPRRWHTQSACQRHLCNGGKLRLSSIRHFFSPRRLRLSSLPWRLLFRAGTVSVPSPAIRHWQQLAPRAPRALPSLQHHVYQLRHYFQLHHCLTDRWDQTQAHPWLEGLGQACQIKWQALKLLARFQTCSPRWILKTWSNRCIASLTMAALQGVVLIPSWILACACCCRSCLAGA
jgi:hypothetical protein